jgi:DNA recombination protein RmuC
VTETIGVVVIAVLVLALVGLAWYALTAKRLDQEALSQLQAGKAGLESRADELATRINSLEADKDELSRRLEVEQSLRVQAVTRLEAEQKNLREQKALLDKAREELTNTFKALSAEALDVSRSQFIRQADEKLQPIQALLDKYQGELRKIEEARNTAYGGIQQNLDGLRDAQKGLQREAQSLATALRNPAVRGRWGELQLERILELSGMSGHFDFGSQETQQTEEGQQRPDVTVHLPNGRDIAVDSKAAIVGYLEAAEAQDDTVREEKLKKYAKAVREHMDLLSAKAYWKQFGSNAPDFVVLFLPGECFFAAALAKDPDLFEQAIQKGVVIATPMTLFALLRAVACGWQEHALAENAEKIGAAGQELFQRVCKFIEHFAKIGVGLDRAREAYNEAYRSYESRVQQSAQRLSQVSAVVDGELPEVRAVDGPIRALPESDERQSGQSSEAADGRGPDTKE